MKTDTIAAIASAMSNAGIGIIRISGDESISVVNKIFQNKQGKSILEHAKSHTIHYGFIYDGNELIDEVLIMIMKSPNSYTTEDIIEIDCHGGILVMNRILETVIKHGARLAEPGEFTKRAFLNGRIDLSKAEAVSDMINAQNDYARKSSIHQLKGSLFDKIHKIREDILYEIAFIESALDDPEHISLEGYPNQLRQKVHIIIEEINKLICSYQNGKILSEGIHTVIVGKPNAGKSSLLNRLVGEDKAIVTSIAGTTRDILEEKIQLHGIQLNMIDTAGICITNDEIEKIGIAKAKKYALDADLIIYVVDASIPLDEKDTQIIHLIRDKKKIILLNKTDLEVKVTEEMLLTRLKECGDTQINNSIIKTSTKTNQGIDLFEDAIRDMFFQGELNFNDEVFLTNLRHKEAMQDTYQSLLLVEKSLDDQMPEDFYSIDLMSAYASLGYIIGEEVGEDLLNEIFSKFCMGK